MAKIFYFWQTVFKKAKWQPWFLTSFYISNVKKALLLGHQFVRNLEMNSSCPWEIHVASFSAFCVKIK
jgi:hypothetical protein